MISFRIDGKIYEQDVFKFASQDEHIRHFQYFQTFIFILNRDQIFLKLFSSLCKSVDGFLRILQVSNNATLEVMFITKIDLMKISFTEHFTVFTQLFGSFPKYW